jgi:hypothetical protein
MTEIDGKFRKRALQREALASFSTFCFPVSRPLFATNQQRVRSWRTSDLLGLATYDRCNTQLEFLNRFDLALLLHWCLAAGNFTLPLSISIVLVLI